ncbi:hypothetical protein QYM36_009528, partial [Artemia franciscana]
MPINNPYLSAIYYTRAQDDVDLNWVWFRTIPTPVTGEDRLPDLEFLNSGIHDYSNEDTSLFIPITPAIGDSTDSEASYFYVSNAFIPTSSAHESIMSDKTHLLSNPDNLESNQFQTELLSTEQEMMEVKSISDISGYLGDIEVASKVSREVKKEKFKKKLTQSKEYDIESINEVIKGN